MYYKKYLIPIFIVIIISLFFSFEDEIVCNYFFCWLEENNFSKKSFFDNLSSLGSAVAFIGLGSTIVTEISEGKEKVIAKILDLEEDRNALKITLDVKNISTKKRFIRLKFLSDNEENIAPNMNMYKLFYDSNKVVNPVFLKNVAYQCFIYMKREKQKAYDDNIIIPPETSCIFTLIIGKDRSTDEKITDELNNADFVFFTDKGTKCVAYWDKEKCKEWMKKQGNT